MRKVLSMLSMATYFLLAVGALAADKATIKKNVDDMVAAINSGKEATSYRADTYTPYAFIMEPNGKLIVHPYLAGEYLQEKAEPIYKALQQATMEGTWVSYLWKGALKETYVRRTKSNLTVGSGY
ncbi:hypothetical protein Despr_2866 [Desulfobulbus propionicus DSM 2032]|uniref:Single Cache domain-containing protein n=2 Tax=Desulfobulbus propionicus TaxID=894 RepID=A0A7U3YP83_DESPD|nr:hypothetical protein Despr_2866 [Desulfobulbus propionicus DSM 2032]